MEAEINCIFTNDKKKVYKITTDKTVKDLKDMITSDSSIVANPTQQVVVIFMGKVLEDDREISSYTNGNESVSFQVVVRNYVNNENVQTVDLKGFDRLTRMEYTEEQIEGMRTEFHRSIGSTNLSEEARTNLEEDWFPVIFSLERPMELFNLNNNNQNDTNATNTSSNTNTNTNTFASNDATNSSFSEENDIDEFYAGHSPLFCFVLGYFSGFFSIDSFMLLLCAQCIFRRIFSPSYFFGFLLGGFSYVMIHLYC